MLQTTPPLAIFVYSRTGHSRRAAEFLGEKLGVAPVKLTAPRYRWPVLGWIRAVRDAVSGKAPKLMPPLELLPQGSVILVGPVWAGAPAAPLNTALEALRDGSQKVAVLLTCGDAKEDAGPVEKIEARLGRPLAVALVLSNAAQETPEGQARIEAFAARIAPQITAAS